MRLLEKLLNDEIRSRARTSQTQARVFSDEVQAVLHRYELKQLTSAEVVERLVEIASGYATRDAATSNSASAARKPRSTTRWPAASKT